MKKFTLFCIISIVGIYPSRAQWLSPNSLTDLNNWSASPRFIGYYNTNLNAPSGQNYGSGIQMVLGEDNRFGSQIIIPTFNDQMFFRRYNGTWEAWNTVWSSNNLNKADVDFNCRNLRANGNFWAKSGND